MTEHYFSAEPISDSHERELEIDIAGHSYRIQTSSGIFSPDGLDKGTAVLLHKGGLPELTTGARIVDLGCGWGPLTLALAAHYPDAHVYGIDVNARARTLAAHNAARAGYNNVTITEDASLTDIDLLWSNPPIRIGKSALHNLLSHWLDRLAPHGVAYLVVQRHLGADSLLSWLQESGYPADKVGSQKGFRVLRVYGCGVASSR
ncbi:class I SAM-dependent methyltransferase [Trueperella sp. LYQ143]|uniref:class I SAM-dependent methyltransferase n=1 Tax=Trueperella sp. LYQ143 TaxID=3391059 RepID=UPI003982E690